MFRLPQFLRRAGVTTTSASGEQASIALGKLFAELPNDRKLFVLDFGPASPGTIEFFSGRSCRIFFEDFYRAWQDRESGVALDEPMLARLLPFAKDVSFDLIFLWDVLNYLNEKDLASLLGYLEKFCRGGSVMTGFLSLAHDIPDQPTVYRITEQGKIRFEIVTDTSRPSPRYAPHVFERLMKKFKLKRMYLLRSGQREFVFTVPPERAAHPSEPKIETSSKTKPEGERPRVIELTKVAPATHPRAS